MIARCLDLTFRYDLAEEDAISGLSLAVEEGELLILAGANGGGKSTLLALLAGLLAPASGSVEVLGLPMPEGRRKIRGRVALLPQNPDVYILGSLVEEDLTLGLPEDDAAAMERAFGLLAELGLEELKGRPVQTLSLGQKRKLCLASALAGGPRLLLLDEPLAGLDFPAAKTARSVLARNKALGLAQVVATHDLDLVADLADRIALMRGGRLEAEGPGERIFPLLASAGVRPPCWWYHGGGPAWLAPGGRGGPEGG
jgi:biotin transport system ATP-binding protein